MSRNQEILVDALKGVAKELGFKSVRGVNYYLNQPETVCVLNLQRSSFGPQFYLNAGVFLARFGEVAQPKEHKCHIRWRLTSLMAPDERAEFEAALDMEADIEEASRAAAVSAGARRHGFEILTGCTTEQRALDIAGQINAIVTSVALN